MRILGINFTAKKEPRWASLESLRELSELVQEVAKAYDSNHKEIEALRKRFERAKVPDNGESPAEVPPRVAVALSAGDTPPPGYEVT